MCRNIIFGILFLFATASCVSTKQSVYFHKQEDGRIQSEFSNTESIIQKNDLLSISISSLNPDASLLFNSPNTNNTQIAAVSGNQVQAQGYLVDQDGYIQFPILGNIKAEGLTKKGLKATIASEIISRKLLLDPIVNIRFLNYKISVLGEVERPAVYTIPNEKVTIFEALGLAGDITIYGKRNNVMLIREENGDKILKRLDLTNSEIFSSPYYYLRSNDILYVEPNKSKVASSRQTNHWLPVIFSAISLMVVVIDRLTR
jgi:polysaccharide export outer membrane protein